ncbi:MAG: hypothetical protein C4576_11590 [Desulfobacteraceae bacterium]|nr:MAG: hypothetical protein C4576_11590 [Desulfobacteraceae bacterium]
MRRTYIVLIIVALLFGGCAISREARIQKIQSRYPQWDQPTVERVAEGRVEIGMTEQMVSAIMGQPAYVAREDHRTVWVYMGSETSSWGVIVQVPAFFVYLEGGRVVEIKGSQRRVVTPLLYSRNYVP